MRGMEMEVTQRTDEALTLEFPWGMRYELVTPARWAPPLQSSQVAGCSQSRGGRERRREGHDVRHRGCVR